MVELVVKRIREAMPIQGSSILLVGRGSSDTQPIHELQQIGVAVEQKNSVYSIVLLFNERNALFYCELKT